MVNTYLPFELISLMILSLLKEHNELISYQIANEIRTKTSRWFKFSENNLFPVLYWLEKEGLIKADTLKIGRRKRKFYSLACNLPEEKEMKVIQALIAKLPHTKP